MAAVEAWETEHPTPESLYRKHAGQPIVQPSRMVALGVAIGVAVLALGLAALMWLA
jgi:hypothetical protein